MKKMYSIFFAAVLFISCSGGTNSGAKTTDTVAGTVTNTPDSAANNGIVPPSAAPGNATNPSLADTSYHAKDSSKKNH